MAHWATVWTDLGDTIQLACADPETFVRGGPTLTTFLVDERRDDPNITKSGPS